MLGIEALSGNALAAALVGIVLFEALLLYVGYGALESVVGASVRRVLEGECKVADVLLRRCSTATGGADK
ncbi:DUF7512 family protein [Haloarchaeobius iranensis]|uniref:Uncharacterized protein n=1 Tax=Haloarchaeobius iranensis TaxID=996166 RepID=A0A1G9ZMC6_9EURY|nr:hypothetical protein [Haloarchaeobius iranensis]SDN22320.1 hypothetical protein SAMN05192554_12126 [Haloarchaeobius iranensis]